MARSLSLLCCLAVAVPVWILPAASHAAESRKTETGKTGRVTSLPRLRGDVPAPRKEAAREETPKKQPAKKEKPDEKTPRLKTEFGMKPDGKTPTGSSPEAKKPGEAETKPDEKKAEKPKAGPAKRDGRRVAVSAELAHSQLLKSLLRAYRRSAQGRIRWQQVQPKSIAPLLASGKNQGAIVVRNAGAPAEKNGSFTPAFHIDLYLIGPPKDPADVNGMVSLPEAMKAIMQSQSAFLSAAPGSGLYRLEHQVWRELSGAPAEDAPWRRAVDSVPRERLGRLLMAARLGAYALVDRVTWLAHTARRGKRRRLRILVRDDPRMQLVVGVLLPPNASGAMTRFRDWLTGEATAKRINRATVNGTRPYLAERGLRR